MRIRLRQESLEEWIGFIKFWAGQDRTTGGSR